MSHTSPASYMVWALLSILLGVFLFFHLWQFDRFKCLKWNSGPGSGAFKRVMTYSYMLSVPLIISYAVGFAVIKYTEGFFDHPVMGIIPMPHQKWSKASDNAIVPLFLCFSIAWSFEMVTHLEELCFWLFLVNAGSAQQDWFKSLYFKTWIVGALIAVFYMPLVTIFTREDVLKCEAYTFLAGSLGSLSLTLWFTPILWTFPSFLANLRAEGVDTATVVRLTKFHEMNTLRVIFRFVFTVPLVILGVDGVRPHQHINESMAGTDFLAMVAALGCVISSGLTLVIFFPRSVEGEILSRELAREKRRQRYPHMGPRQDSMVSGPTNLLDIPSPVKYGTPPQSERGTGMPYDGRSPTHEHSQKTWEEHEREPSPFKPNRRVGSDVEMGSVNNAAGTLSESNVSRHNMSMNPKVNNLVYNFKSPIDLAYGPPGGSANASRLTFTQRN